VAFSHGQGQYIKINTVFEPFAAFRNIAANKFNTHATSVNCTAAVEREGVLQRVSAALQQR